MAAATITPRFPCAPRHSRAGARACLSHWRRSACLCLVAALLALVAFSSHALDVNTANAEQLQTLNGIGPKTAALIIEERERGGAFASLQDLSDRVRGIGPKRLEALQAGGATASNAAGQPAGIAADQPSAEAPPSAPANP